VRIIPLIASLVFCSNLLAQDAFDLVVVKPNPRFVVGSYGRAQPGGRYLWTGYTVEQLVIWAYGVWPFQVQGGPDWVRGAHWGIEAKVDGMRGTLDRDSVRPLLQKLLATRFGLRVRKEDRPGDVYELQIGPKGARIRAGDGQHWDPKLPAGYNPPPLPPPPPDYKGSVTPSRADRSGTGPGYYYLDGAPITNLVNYLSWLLEVPIADKTGLTGTYEGMLELGGDDNGTSIYKAIREQWGLQLAKHKGTNPHIVIEAVTKPAEN